MKRIFLFALWLALLAGCTSFPAIEIGTGQPSAGDGDYARAMALRSSSRP
jgi:hypothetical protein